MRRTSVPNALTVGRPAAGGIFWQGTHAALPRKLWIRRLTIAHGRRGPAPGALAHGAGLDDPGATTVDFEHHGRPVGIALECGNRGNETGRRIAVDADDRVARLDAESLSAARIGHDEAIRAEDALDHLRRHLESAFGARGEGIERSDPYFVPHEIREI